MQRSTTTPRPPMRTGAEYDALTRARRVYCYLSRAGAAASIKRQYRRRERAEAKRALRAESQLTA